MNIKIPEKLLKILVSVLFCGVFVACNTSDKNIHIPGVTYITSLGNPIVQSLVWSPKDPAKILVSSHDLMEIKSKVYVIDTITKKKTKIADTKIGKIRATAWSPNGKQIALTINGGMEAFPGGGLWMINTENGSKEKILDQLGGSFWLPDGNTIAIVTGEYAFAQNSQRMLIYLMDIHTKEMKMIYSNEEATAYSGLSSSPDGKYLVFSVKLGPNDYAEDLFILDVQTGTVTQLTDDGGNSFPVWSPHGDLIVYQKLSPIGNGTTSLHITPLDRSCDIMIPISGHAYSPTWSPDGKKIAFIGEDGIYVLDTDIVFGRDIYQGLCP